MLSWDTFTGTEARKAAAVVITRGGRDGEVLLVRRNPKLRFMGGHHAFPGGSLDASDEPGYVVWDGEAEQARRIFAVVREVFEETGLLLAEGNRPAGHVLRQRRIDLDAGRCTFSEILTEYGLRIRGCDFVPAGVWITPPFSPMRFDTQYFLYRYDGPKVAELIEDDGEIVGLDWLRPSEARYRWHADGSIRLSTPVAFVLTHLARFDVAEALPRLARTPGRATGVPNRFELRPGVYIIPLRTNTLPPAQHTNCVIIGEREFYVIDPGAEDPEEQEQLAVHLDDMLDSEGRVAAVLLTHSHRDHVGAAAFVAQRYGAGIWAHPRVGQEAGLELERELGDGEILDVVGEPAWRIRCLHTPGHDPGHLCFIEESTKTLVCGDMIANPGTILVARQQEGDMTQYIESLERLLDVDFSFAIPSHGLPTWNNTGKDVIRALIAHRLDREEKIKTALEDGATSYEAVVRQAYDDTPEKAWPLARIQVEAHLARLGISLADRA